MMNLPNQLTVLRIVLTPIFLWTLFTDHLGIKILSLAIFIIASLTDLYDGYIAKKYNYVTMVGKFLDPLADKILVSAALIAFHLLGYIQLWVVIAILARDFLVTFLRLYALSKKRHVETQELARAKTAFQMTSIFVVYAFILIEYFLTTRDLSFGLIDFLNKIYFIDIMMGLIAVFTVVTGVHYLVVNSTLVKTILADFASVFISQKRENK